MIGIGLLIFILIWGFIAVWLGKVLSGKFFARHVLNQSGRASIKGGLITLLIIVLIFILPIADEIISYPSYYSMCEDAGRYKFASGMNEEKVFGREYRVEINEEKLVRLFPTFRELVSNESANFGVIIKTEKLNLVDDQTNELLLTAEIVQPLRSFSAIPWDGKRITWLLHQCTTNVGKNGEESQKFIRSLNMHLNFHLD